MGRNGTDESRALFESGDPKVLTSAPTIQTMKIVDRRMAMEVKRMRESGVYALPDGREVIARRGGRYDFFKLYDPLAWKYQGPPMYEADAQGKITSFGRPTPWRVQDLKEIGLAKEKR